METKKQLSRVSLEAPGLLTSIFLEEQGCGNGRNRDCSRWEKQNMGGRKTYFISRIGIFTGCIKRNGDYLFRDFSNPER